LQARVSAECGHALPPSLGSSLARVRFCEPPPHDLVHVDQAVQLGTSQSTAQGKVLQGRVSWECGHAAPPNFGATLLRLRCCEPVPHDLVHVDQAPKVRTTQLTGHADRLQVRISWACGHTLPPNLGAVRMRLRRCAPVPHDLVQVDHALKAP